MKKMSIVGKDYHTDEQVVGYYNTGDRMKYWGKMGAFWGGIWGWLFGAAFFMIPGLGPILVAGPLVAWIVGALEGAVLVGGLSALGAGLYSIGIPKDSVVKYETALKIRQVPPNGSWHSGRSGEGQGHHANDTPCGGYSARGEKRATHWCQRQIVLLAAAEKMGCKRSCGSYAGAEPAGDICRVLGSPLKSPGRH